jgi:hypothetical protein
MGDAISIHITKRSQQDFFNRLQKVEKMTGKSMYRILHDAARYFIQSAAKETPKSKKKRKVRTVGKRKNAGFKFVVEAWSKGK